MNPQPEATSANAGQALFWTDVPGQKWAHHHERLDHLFGLITDELLARAAPQPGQSVLDVGCGCGDTALRAADRVGESGQVEGVDISDVLLAVARRRAAGRVNVSFTRADAQVQDFAEDRHDLLISRFGLMFFADPVAAFANLARALKPGSPLVFATWAPAADNPWSHVTKSAGMARLGAVPPDPPREPGQFAFAEPGYVAGILRDAGLTNIVDETVDTHLVCAGTATDAADLATSIGPVSRLMRDKNGTEADRIAIATAVAKEFARYERADSVCVPARVHFFRARKG
ncbi:Demethylmenaquinone methyltransferase [Defluviimonas aquaemixtae]|uniref:Demethylmenaquinone methyltransferase n=1 Tax=Albidovulum aquaemixtae TaxID=1542388 RepID=A0A2R8BMG8_9RHOB|nr:class I SAM-dependent methyltransferase [Defluviimonas aquaemixtae]SPH24604.1 Demethylmenaquinone methyltransferase [Defluviimonas aquaemixtae]